MNCSIQGCGAKIYARGWCRRHYRHVAEGKHVHPLPIYLKCKSCQAELKVTAKNSGLCKTCYRIEWTSFNAESLKQYRRQYRHENKEKIKKSIDDWRANNKEHINSYYAEKRKDPHYRLTHNLRSRLYDFLKGKIKHKRTLELTGCSKDELVVHLENQFLPGMTWDNYGHKWVVDHIVPLCSVNIENKEELEKACHFSNLRPIWYDLNSSKATQDKLWKQR